MSKNVTSSWLLCLFGSPADHRRKHITQNCHVPQPQMTKCHNLTTCFYFPAAAEAFNQLLKFSCMPPHRPTMAIMFIFKWSYFVTIWFVLLSAHAFPYYSTDKLIAPLQRRQSPLLSNWLIFSVCFLLSFTFSA